MDYGIKITAAGHGITTTDVTKILMSSQYSMLKYHSDTTGSTTITAGNTTGGVSVNHSLGYVPMAIGYVIYTGDSYQRMIPEGRVPNPVAISIYSTSALVRCKIVQAAAGGDLTYNFRVIIFKDKIV